MATAEEHLMDWLRDAHAMEEQAEKMLRATAGRLENYPDLKARLESHASETHRQAERLKGCLDRRGTSRSEEHTSELQSLMRISYAVFCLKKQKKKQPKS